MASLTTPRTTTGSGATRVDQNRVEPITVDGGSVGDVAPAENAAPLGKEKDGGAPLVIVPPSPTKAQRMQDYAKLDAAGQAKVRSDREKVVTDHAKTMKGRVGKKMCVITVGNLLADLKELFVPIAPTWAELRQHLRLLVNPQEANFARQWAQALDMAHSEESFMNRLRACSEGSSDKEGNLKHWARLYAEAAQSETAEIFALESVVHDMLQTGRRLNMDMLSLFCNALYAEPAKAHSNLINFFTQYRIADKVDAANGDADDLTLRLELLCRAVLDNANQGPITSFSVGRARPAATPIPSSAFFSSDNSSAVCGEADKPAQTFAAFQATPGYMTPGGPLPVMPPRPAPGQPYDRDLVITHICARANFVGVDKYCFNCGWEPVGHNDHIAPFCDPRFKNHAYHRGTGPKNLTFNPEQVEAWRRSGTPFAQAGLFPGGCPWNQFQADGEECPGNIAFRRCGGPERMKELKRRKTDSQQSAPSTATSSGAFQPQQPSQRRDRDNFFDRGRGKQVNFASFAEKVLTSLWRQPSTHTPSAAGDEVARIDPEEARLTPPEEVRQMSPLHTINKNSHVSPTSQHHVFNTSRITLPQQQLHAFITLTFPAPTHSRALLDSGSTLNAISRSFFHQHLSQTYRVQSDNNTSPCQVLGSSVLLHDYVILDLPILDKSTRGAFFLVSDFLNFDILVGDGILRALRIDLLYSTQQVCTQTTTGYTCVDMQPYDPTITMLSHTDYTLLCQQYHHIFYPNLTTDDSSPVLSTFLFPTIHTDHEFYLIDAFVALRIYADQIRRGTRAPANLIFLHPPYYWARDYIDHFLNPRDKLTQFGFETSVFKYLDALSLCIRLAVDCLSQDGFIAILVGEHYADKKQVDHNGKFATIPPLSACLIPEKVSELLLSADLRILNRIIWDKPNSRPSTGTRKRLKFSHDIIYVADKNKPSTFATHPEAVRIPLQQTTIYHKQVPKLPLSTVDTKPLNDVWTVPPPHNRSTCSGTLPLSIPYTLILFLTPDNGTVMDVFGGLHKVRQACELLGRKSITFDVRPRSTYFRQPDRKSVV